VGRVIAPTRAGRRRAALAAGLSVLVLAAACTSTIAGVGRGATGAPSGSAGPSSPNGGGSTGAHATASFGSCRDLFDGASIPVTPGLSGHLSYGCATLKVPLDYGNPYGRQLGLQLVRVRDSADNAPIGSLLVNPGGPGGSGVELALGLVGRLAPTILEHFDLIGFDPRGVGLSSPIRCVDAAQEAQLTAASPDLSTAAGMAEAEQDAASFDSACAHKYGSALGQFSTVNTARDMDRIRAAVGDRQMNYLGFSYGTELGSVYAHLFPRRVRVAVLDGAVDPLTSGVAQLGDQLEGFEKAFDQFAANCERDPSCAPLGNPRAVALSVLATAQQQPLSTSSGRRLTGSLASAGIGEALYSRSEWPALADALISARRGDGTGLLALSDRYYQRNPDGSYENIFDAYTAISCNDSASGLTEAALAATAKSWATKYPLSGRWHAGPADLLPYCQQWQPVRTVPPKPSAPTTTKVLVIGNLHDPATPYQGAKDLAATMGNARLLSWDGQGHTSYLEGSSCADGYVNQYLVHQTLPPAGEVCPA
jgi:pimeloyl-ACP methyl ester carboxylesterase